MAKKLLLADDSVTIQKVVGISFANEDVEILTVDNGDDALTRARETLPDIVLADVVMPGKNGYEVCEVLKADSQLSHVPVLLLTGTFEAFDEERASRVGADGHITKPFEAQSLVDQVNQLLARAPRTPAAGAPAANAEPEPSVSEQQAVDLGAAEGAPPDGDGAFDFFEEDLPVAAPSQPAARDAGDVLEMPSSPETSFAEPGAETALETGVDEGAAPDTTAFDLDGGESAFDLAPMVDEPAPGRAGEDATVVTPEVPSREAEEAGDRTVAIGVEMPDAEADEETWPEDDDLDAAFGEEELGSLDMDAPEGEQAGELEGLDLDVGMPQSLDATGSAPGESEGSETTEPGEGRELLEQMEPSQDARQTLLDPDAEDAFAVSSSDLGDPLAASGRGEPATGSPPPAGAPGWPQEAAEEPPEPRMEAVGGPEAAGAALEAAPGRPAEAPQDLVTPVRDARPDLSPEMRERVHDSLEKIAWEAFADLPDTVVRHAVAKIEEIAWEVIPQMAEALIREEIRRLKAEEE